MLAARVLKGLFALGVTMLVLAAPLPLSSLAGVSWGDPTPVAHAEYYFPPCGPGNDGETVRPGDGVEYVCKYHDGQWCWVPTEGGGSTTNAAPGKQQDD